MSFEDLNKLLSDHESFLQGEFSKMRQDLGEIQKNFEELNLAVEEEEAFLANLRKELENEGSALKKNKVDLSVQSLIKKEGDLDKAIARVHQEVEKISNVTSGISSRWDGHKPLSELHKMAEDLEALKARWQHTQLQKEKLQKHNNS